MLRVSVMIVPGRREVAKAFVSAQADHQHDTPAVVRSKHDRRVGVEVRCTGLFGERFVSGDTRIAALRLNARDSDRDPASNRERLRRAARAMVHGCMSF